MLLSNYTAEQLFELKKRLQAVKNMSVPLMRLTPKEGVCGLDIVDILFRLELAPAHAIYAKTDWYDSTTFDVKNLTVGQVLTVWDEIIHLPA